tara:strand:+ start:182 stop:367 length:186 start_codon:yes stop_codon:yes gene_type:complete
MDDYAQMLDEILEWAESNIRFDASTMEGIKTYYDEHMEFTDSQETAIENVYYKWNIDKWRK